MINVSPTTRSFSDMTSDELSAGYRKGQFTPIDVAEYMINAVNLWQPLINAFCEFDPARVLADAHESTVRWHSKTPLSPLDGVPITVKENILRRGIPTRQGNKGTHPLVPTNNSPIVDRLITAGAVIIGTTTMPDWGMLSSGVSSLHGIIRSPWDTSLTAGGSSAGAGAAAAAGIGTFHMGTDIGGSVRFPAAWLGLSALKPSAGRIPLDAPYLGRVAGPLARHVKDLATALTYTSQPDLRDPTSLPPHDIDWSELSVDVKGSTIGLHLDAGAGMPVNAEITAAVCEAANVFAGAGAHIVDIPPFIDDQLLIDIDEFWRIRFWRIYQTMPAADRVNILPYIACWAEGGRHADGVRTLECYEATNRMAAQAVAATAHCDIVLSPTAPVPAFPAEWPMPWGDDDLAMPHLGFTVAYNMSGQPAANINCGFTSDHKAIGLQIAGPRFADLAVLKFAQWYELNRPESSIPKFPNLPPQPMDHQ